MLLPLPSTFLFEGQPVRYGVIGSGAPLVMVHGTPFNAQVWRRIAPILACGYQVYYYDLLGYGQSHMAAGQDVSLGVQNRLFAALLQHWRLQRPHVLAHDFGGATVLRAWLLDGCRYQSLTLVDPVALSPWGSPFVQHVRTHEAAFSGMPAYMHAALLPAYIAGAAFTPLAPATLALYSTPWQGEPGQAAFYRQIAQMDTAFTTQVQARYGEIDCPVQILWGEEDAWIALERGQALAAVMPGATFIPVPEAGHLVQEDAPEMLVAALLGFLPPA